MISIGYSSDLAERQGFEPWEGCPSTVFKTAAIDRSAISPPRIISQPKVVCKRFWSVFYPAVIMMKVNTVGLALKVLVFYFLSCTTLIFCNSPGTSS